MVRSRAVLMLACSLVAMTTAVAPAQKMSFAQSVRQCITIEYTKVCLGQYVRFEKEPNGSLIAGKVVSLTDSGIQVNGEAGGGLFTSYLGLRNVRLYALNQNERLEKGSQLMSPNGCYTLSLQDDGNLVTYGPGGIPLWRSGKLWRGNGFAVLQADSNFVVYAGNRPAWSSNTYRRGGSRLVIQDDSNVVMLTAGGRPVWDTGTGGKRCNR